MFSVLFQNSDFIIINKAPGIGFHNEENSPGICSLVRNQFNMDPSYPVHRLDKPTSGLLIFAKNRKYARIFYDLFCQKKITKYYLAISKQKPKKKQGKIMGDMVRSRNKSWKLIRSTTNPAITFFKTFSIEPGLKLFLLKPVTGKTHQLRVALKSLGSPILGDSIYAPSISSNETDRTYLHSYYLKFEIFGDTFEYKCDPDSGKFFKSCKVRERLDDMGNPDHLNWPKSSE